MDLCLFHEIQVHYIAAPILKNVSDPIEQRFGVLNGETDTVSTPEIELSEPSRRFSDHQRRIFATSSRPYEDMLTGIARAIASTAPAGPHPWGGTGRHHALFCGSLSASNLVRRYVLESGSDVDDMQASARGIFEVLTAAGAEAGIEPAAEIERTINNAWREGGLI